MRDTARRLRAGGTLHRPFVVAERGSGAVVAFGLLYREPVHSDPRAGWVSGLVDPSARHRGIGAQLLARLSAEAGSLGIRSLFARLGDDRGEGIGFLLRRGFLERRRSLESTLEIGRSEPPSAEELGRRAAAIGVRLTTWGEAKREDPHAESNVYALSERAGADVPSVGPPPTLSLDQFRRWVLDNPLVPADGLVLAVDGGRYVGMSYGNLLPDDPSTFVQQFTGTLREYRGRGIATVLKQRVIAVAAQRGVARVLTSNDAENAAILSVNRRLGFRPSRTWVTLERPE